MSYEINVLVNGSRCKQYHHEGKTFIEAKKGSEYTIEIKNNVWNRILAVASVDGLDVLSGKHQPLEESNGYVINGYASLKIDGFRISDNEVAKFVFDYKGSSYAAAKEDGSERNVGVIAARIYAEKVKPLPPPPIVIKEEHHHHHHHNDWWNRPWPWKPTIWCDGLTSQQDITYGCNLSNAGTDSLGCTDCSDSDLNAYHGRVGGNILRSMNCSAPNNMGEQIKEAFDKSKQKAADTLVFDMGTKFGEAKESRVVEVEFEKGILTLSTNIYYASRQSLIEMGIPLGNEKQVSFPEPFADDKYAKPPKGWTKRY